MKVAYVRVSTAEQNEARQIEALKPHGIERWYIEKISAKDANRPKLQEMLDFIRAGDTVYIHDLSRIARNTQDLLSILDIITEKGAQLVSNKEFLDTSTSTGKLMLTMLGAINEFERANMLDRQREGIAIAKAAGKYKGGKAKSIDKNVFEAAHARYMRREICKAQLARELHISRPTLDKLLREKAEAAAAGEPPEAGAVPKSGT